MSTPEDIDVETVDACPSCGTIGGPLYVGVRDHTFGTPGEWSLDRCCSCGLIWLNPRPIPSDIDKVYRTYYTHSLTSQGSTFSAHMKLPGLTRRLISMVTGPMRRVKDAVLAVRMGYASVRSGGADVLLANTLGRLPGVARSAAMETLGLTAAERGRLLDVGCGNGTFLSRMSQLGWQCTGVETDPLATAFAREHFGLDIRQGTLGQAAFSEGSFDVVTLSHVIEHVHTPHDLLIECRRVLRPGGKLIVLTPNVRGLGHRIFGPSWRGLEPPRHLQVFTPDTLRTYVERAQMQTIRLSTEAQMMRSIWYASRLIQRAESGRGSRNNLADYVLAYSMQIVETIACRLVAHVGEEIMLVARKAEYAGSIQGLSQ